MKMKHILFALLIFVAFSQPASALFYVDITPQDGYRPTQFNLTLHNGSGVNTVTDIYLNGNNGTNFADVYFTLPNATILNHWIEDNATGKTWINLTSNGSFRIWYGNLSHASTSNGSQTFPVFCCDTPTLNTSTWASTGTPTISGTILTLNAVGEQIRTNQLFPSGYAFQANVTASATTGSLRLSMNTCPTCIDWNPTTDGNKYTDTRNGASTSVSDGAYTTANSIYSFNWFNSSRVNFFYNRVLKQSHTTNIPPGPYEVMLTSETATSYNLDKIFLRNISSPELTITSVSAEQEVQYLPIVASDTVQYSNTTSIDTSSLSYVLASRIVLLDNYNGSYRVEKYSYGDTAQTSEFYLNSQLIGTLSSGGIKYFNSSGLLNNGDVLSWYIKSGFGFNVHTVYFNFNFDYDYTNFTPTLQTPANGSILSFDFPPQTDDITFTWSGIGTSGYQFQVAEDAAFNLLEYDITTTTNTTTKAIDAGTHYWRVRTTNTGVDDGNWSDTFSFLFTESVPAISGAAIQGVVYFLSGGSPVPLQSATVFLYNSTFTQQKLTGTNGYFLFENLDNGSVYFIKASLKDYQTSEIITINVSGVMTYNIQMKPVEPTFFENDKQYVLFTSRYMFCWSDCEIEGATMTVYNYGESTPVQIGGESNPKTTDTTGSASFLLFKTQRYRITLVNASASISSEITLYPKDPTYLWLITRSNDAFQDHDILEKDAIITTVSKSVINSTAAFINITFNDTQAQTTNMTVYLNQSNSSLSTWTANGNGTHSFLVTNYQGKSYLIHFYGIGHPEYGTIDYTYSILFEKTSVGISGIPDTLWLWFAVGIMFFTAAIFTSSTVELGLIIVCAEGWIFLALGMFGSLGTTGTTRFGIALTLISVLAIMAYAKRQQTKEGYT